MNETPTSNEILDENALLSIQGVIDVLDQHFENDEMQCQIYINSTDDQSDAMWTIVRALIGKPFSLQQEGRKVILYITDSQWESQPNHSKLMEILHRFSTIDINEFKVESWSQHKANSN